MVCAGFEYTGFHEVPQFLVRGLAQVDWDCGGDSTIVEGDLVIFFCFNLDLLTLDDISFLEMVSEDIWILAEEVLFQLFSFFLCLIVDSV